MDEEHYLNEPEAQEGFHFIQKKGDLFSTPETESLAHCISEDCRMGKGIAVIFKKKFAGIEDLKRQDKKPGEVAVLKRGQRFVYYLITKAKANDKPTYDTLKSSLKEMKRHCKQNNVTHLSIPRIGCGLDGLDWDEVSVILCEIFSDMNLILTVYAL
ncbi:hypothetical protein KUTeg_006915 [Tegillarca granosa]|uniref:Macro domain-containing protein n=1 Tax=Tegillarca granosa TaxID=220873 RepID=A0ABQ9FBQ0_TEGGR|nr:hypothetical protein KUTeg_006915 [Tegillarca granosa]